MEVIAGRVWARDRLLFGRGMSKSTTQGSIFDLLLYVTFDCAGIAAFQKHHWNAHVQAY